MHYYITNVTSVTLLENGHKTNLSVIPNFFIRTNLCVYVLSSVLWCPLRFPHKIDVRFVFTSSCLLEGSCLIYLICVCLRIVLCFLFICLCPVSCLSNFSIFSGLSILDGTFVFSNIYLTYFLIYCSMYASNNILVLK
jgi:hypothetical protein